MKRFLVIFEKADSGFSAYIPDLPGCVAFGDTKEETEELIYEAIKFHIEGMIQSNIPITTSVVDSEMMVFM